MEKKEKPLEKLTAKELREMALGIPGIQGVHAMKKEELIAAIRKAKGIPEEPKKEKKIVAKKEKVVLTTAELKKKVKELRQKKEEALQQNNWKMVEILKKRISRYKKMTRRAA
jgi:ribosomal protein S18